MIAIVARLPITTPAISRKSFWDGIALLLVPFVLVPPVVSAEDEDVTAATRVENMEERAGLSKPPAGKVTDVVPVELQQYISTRYQLA